MKRSAKAIVVAIMSLLLSVLLCACGLNDSQSGTTDDNKPVSYGTATVRYHYEYDVVVEHYYQEKYSIRTGEDYKLTELFTPPVDVGYRFVGWTLKPGGEGDIIGSSFTIVGAGFGGTVYDFYAKLEPIRFTVVYHLDGGKNDSENPISLVGKQTLKDPTKDKHKFLGWYRTPDFSGYTVTASMVDNSTTIVDLYAKWQRVYEINYVSDQDGLEVVGDRSFFHYTEYTEDREDLLIYLEPEYYYGYMFLGWELETGAELVERAEITLKPSETKRDLTYTAHYLEASYPINTEGLRLWVMDGRSEYYLREGVEKIIVSDKYGKKDNQKTYKVVVYYSGETPPEVVCRDDIEVLLFRDPEKVEEKF